MDNIKDDTYFIKKLLEDMSFINGNMNNISDRNFSKNEILQDAMMFRLIQKQ